MFSKNDAERIFSEYGFNDSSKNDETIEKTAKAFTKNEYTVANGPKGRNRLNSGILRNQFILLLNSLNEKPLNDYTFTGVSLLRDNQYVLVHQEENSELWKVYQGNSPNNPKLIYNAITLKSFFDETTNENSKGEVSIAKPLEQDESIENRKIDFILWLSQKCRGTSEFQKHIVSIIEKRLDGKIPNSQIGNLFRFGNSSDYDIEKERIFKLPTWNSVNESDANGRPRTALNHYSNFLKELEFQNDNPSPTFTPAQIIYYGVPGCGKSRKITNLIETAKQSGEITDEETQVARVVFHPEYTNADFVGQVMPVIKPGEGVNYDFAAGPFTRILARAYANPTKPYYLIVEEINRGNAAAIFGEIFQLLDRHKKGESDSVGGNTYTAGWSKYFVDHEDVNGIIRKEISKTSYEKDEDKQTIKFTENTAIRLPPNLSIYATMNTSDQNVFTLDNAFKRRFDFELVKNSLDGDEHKAQSETKIEGADVTWGAFWKSINELILEKHSAMTSSEDKRLGAYFVVGEEKSADGKTYREISKKLFGEKVLEYLWNDAFKYKRKDVFNDECKSIEQLIEIFSSKDLSAVFKNLFQEN